MTKQRDKHCKPIHSDDVDSGKPENKRRHKSELQSSFPATQP